MMGTTSEKVWSHLLRLAELRSYQSAGRLNPFLPCSMLLTVPINFTPESSFLSLEFVMTGQMSRPPIPTSIRSHLAAW